MRGTSRPRRSGAPCPERCPPCASGPVDLCFTGHYVEGGIVGVLTEPLGVALKGIENVLVS